MLPTENKCLACEKEKMLLPHFSEWVSPMALLYTELCKKEGNTGQPRRAGFDILLPAVSAWSKIYALDASVSATHTIKHLFNWIFFKKETQISLKSDSLEFPRGSCDRYIRPMMAIWLLLVLFINLFTHSFHKYFSEHLLCARHSFRCWRYRGKIQIPELIEIAFLDTMQKYIHNMSDDKFYIEK